MTTKEGLRRLIEVVRLHVKATHGEHPEVARALLDAVEELQNEIGVPTGRWSGTDEH